MRRALMMTAPLWLLAMAAASQAAETAKPADNTDVQEVTVIATRTEKKVVEVPATVSVITAKDIDDQMVDDIKDLVRYEPGVSVRSAPARFTAAGSSVGRDGNSGFNIRGLEGNRVLIQIDGIRVPDAFSFGAQSVGRGDYVGLDTLKSVEILRGPASALYGSDGVAGAVSYTTREPSDFLKSGHAFGGQVKLGYSSADDSWGKGAVLAGQKDKWQGMIAYSRRDGHEQETNGSNAANNITRTMADPQDVSSNAGLAKIVYTPAEGHRLRLTYDHLDSVTDTNVVSTIAVPPLVASSTLDLQAHDTTNRNRVGFDYRYRGTGLIDAADVVVYSQTSRTTQFAAEDRNTSADRTRLNRFDTKVVGVNFDLVSRFETGAITHELVYGADLSTTRQLSLRDGTIPPVGETYPTRAFPTTDYTRVGVFVQDEIGVLDGRLKIYPAIRYDSYDLKPKTDALLTTFVPAKQNGNHVSPKLSAVFKATDSVGLFANYAEGFKAPAPSEVNNAFSNLVSNYKSIPNPNLKPETSRTLEGGLRVNQPIWDASVSAFSGSYKNFIDQVLIGGSYTATDPAIYQFVNLGQVKIDGVEARARVTFNANLTLNAAMSSTRGTTTSSGVKSPLVSIDPFKAVAGLSYRDSTGRFGGAFSATYSAKKATDRAGCTTCYIPDAFTTLDVTGWWNVTPNVTLRAGIFNLGDTKYAWWSDVRGLAATSTVKDAYTQPGRNGSVSLSYHF